MEKLLTDRVMCIFLNELSRAFRHHLDLNWTELKPNREPNQTKPNQTELNWTEPNWTLEQHPSLHYKLPPHFVFFFLLFLRSTHVGNDLYLTTWKGTLYLADVPTRCRPTVMQSDRCCWWKGLANPLTLPHPFHAELFQWKKIMEWGFGVGGGGGGGGGLPFYYTLPVLSSSSQ